MGQEVAEVKEKILNYLATVDKARIRDVVRAVAMDKDLVSDAIGELARDGKVEYQGFGGITYVVLKGK
ncbi:hypothetical protein M1N57_02015 [Dehalococcoidales bacterium]|nr:hypothetical protein [Dehalococcoidales bacterium]